MDFWSQIAWMGLVASPLLSSVTLGKLTHVSLPWFPHSPQKVVVLKEFIKCT